MKSSTSTRVGMSSRIPVPLRFTLKFLLLVYVLIGLWAISIRHLVPSLESWARSRINSPQKDDCYEEARLAFARGDIESIRALTRENPVSIINHPHESFWRVAIEDLPNEIAEDMVLASTKYDLNRHGFDGSTPLHIAMMAKREDLVLLMLEHGANPNRTTVYWVWNANSERANGNLWHIALQTGQERFMRELIQQSYVPNLDQHNRSDQSLLDVAIELGDKSLITEILEMGADVNDHAADGKTALHRAVEAGDVETAQLLLERGADPNTPVMWPDTFFGTFGKGPPLLCAAVKGNLRMIDILAEAGADVDAELKDGSNWRAVHILARFPRGPEFMSLLVQKYGADVNAQDSYGRTPLDIACSFDVGDETVQAFTALGALHGHEIGEHGSP